MWGPTMTPVAPVEGGALGVEVRDGSAAIVAASAMGRARVLAEAPSCPDPSTIGYFISSGGVGAAVGCPWGALMAWARSAPRPSPYVAWAGSASLAYLAALSIVRLAGRSGGSRR